MLGADTGVTKSDLAIWRDHLGRPALERFVVLNKIDTLADPLLPRRPRCSEQIEQQRRSTARDAGRAGVSACFRCRRAQALAARVDGDARGAGRQPPAGAGGRLGRRAAAAAPRGARAHGGRDACRQLSQAAARRLGDRRRQLAEQMLELRGLRGKSGAKVQLMLRARRRRDARVRALHRAAGGAARGALRACCRTLLVGLSSDALRDEVAAMQAAMARARCSTWARKQGLRRACARGCAQR